MVATATEIRTSSIGELHEHAGEAIKLNHAEAGQGRLNVDWERLRALERAGCAICLAAWHGSEIVGYSLGFVLDQIDSLDRYYQNHVLFVMPDHRKQDGLGKRLIRATEGAADAAGCVLIAWQSVDSGPLARILPRLGYDEGERIYTKTLKEGKR